MKLEALLKMVREAGDAVLSIYNRPGLTITSKEDGSALTEADLVSHQVICDALKTLYPMIPVLSEESGEFHDPASRKEWSRFFLVDPLDGTKEFIQRNGEFTINLALIEDGVPVLGILHAPALQTTYYALRNHGAFKQTAQGIVTLPLVQPTSPTLRVVTSRSHLNPETKAFVERLKETQTVSLVPIGSALKFGLLAEGSADIYPRLAPTMEWDTAAGQAILEEAGGEVRMWESGELLKYNTGTLVNPSFVARGASAPVKKDWAV